MLICEIQNSSEANTAIKQMKIQAGVVAKELRVHNSNAQHKHELKIKMVDHEHVQLMVNERTKQLELELQLEEAKICHLEAQSDSHNGNSG